MRHITPITMDILSYIWSFTSYKLTERLKYSFSSEEILGQTSYGPVKGLKTTSTAFGYKYISFMGIPYAKPPVGELRFKDPLPPDPWQEAPTEFVNGGSQAWQKDMVFKRCAGNENCLHLNIYTKDMEPKTLKPVMVWIHGGAFILGSNTKDIYNPELLLRKDIVLVVINYRLGAFGFLSLNDPELKIPGNAALKDQVLALKWVKANCHNFGGDPNNITLFGESAGGVSVHLHMVSEMSAGLFHKAIVMSGSIYVPWAVTHIKDWAHRLANALGWNGEGGDRAIYDLLMKTSSENITKAQDKILTLEDRKEYRLIVFGPSVEPYVGEQSFLTQNPKILIRNCWSRNIPLVMGFCSEEGLLFYKYVMKKPAILAKAKLDYLAPLVDFDIGMESDRAVEIGQRLQEFYFGFTNLKPETILAYLMIFSDKHFIHGLHRTILERSSSPESAPTYVYRFNIDSPSYSFVKGIFAAKGVPGTCHGDDLPFLFKPAFLGKIPNINSSEWKTIDRMCESFVTFATTGNPNNETLSPVQWDPISRPVINSKTNRPSYKCLNIAENVQFIDLPEAKRMQFWDNLYKDSNVELI